MAAEKKYLIKAFTLLEMIFVMMLTAIVTGLTYMYFTQFSHYLKKSTSSDNFYVNFNLFCFVLNKDLSESSVIRFNGKDEIYTGFDDKKETLYRIEKNFIIRESESSTDTFKFKIKDLKIQELEKHYMLVNQIEFNASIDSGNFISYSFLKEYPSETLFHYYEPKQE